MRQSQPSRCRPGAKHLHATAHPQLQQPLLLLQRGSKRNGNCSTRAAGDSAANASSSNTSSSGTHSRAQAAPAAAVTTSQGGLQEVLRDATNEFQGSLALLKDAAGAAFIPGYKPRTGSSSSSSGSTASSSSSRKRPIQFRSYSSIAENAAATARPSRHDVQEIESIPSRLGRLLTGRVIREAAASSNSKNKQPFDAKLAAIQCELQAAQQQQQQQGQDAAAAAGAPVIDMVPEPTVNMSQQQDRSNIGQPAATTAFAAAATTPGSSSSADTQQQQELGAAIDTYPATTQMLVFVTWAVFALQWWPALPLLWQTVQSAGVVQAAVALLFMYPDTAVTQAMCMDFSKVKAGHLSGLLTSGFLHSGLAGTWLFTKALSDSARWIEIGMGPMQLLATYVITSFCASCAHIMAGTTLVGIAGAGAVIGIYTTWVILATQALKQDLPVLGLLIDAGLVLVLGLGFGVLQPAIGLASIMGGVLGGALAVKLAGPLASAMKWALAVPFLALLFVLRMGIDGVKLVLLALIPVIVTAVQSVLGLFQAVRRL